MFVKEELSMKGRIRGNKKGDVGKENTFGWVAAMYQTNTFSTHSRSGELDLHSS